MNRTLGRIALASSCLVMGGLAVAPAASAAPTLIPRHEASTLVAPDPGQGMVDPSADGCGAGRFAVRCAVPAGASVTVQVPAAAQHALAADASSVAVPSAVVADAAVQVPAAALHAMAGDMTDAPVVPVLPTHIPKRY